MTITFFYSHILKPINFRFVNQKRSHHDDNIVIINSSSITTALLQHQDHDKLNFSILW